MNYKSQDENASTCVSNILEGRKNVKDRVKSGRWRKKMSSKEWKKDSAPLDTFDGAKPRFLNRGEEGHSVSTLSIPRSLDRGVEGLILKGEKNEMCGL
jgi:hypothetical protein